MSLRHLQTNLSKSGRLMLLAALFAVSPIHAASLYWDGNSTTAGAGNTVTFLNQTWGTAAVWNSDSTGGSGGSFTTTTASGDDLYFVAGPSATSGNVAYTVTVSGSPVANSLNFQVAGATTISGGTMITLGDGTAGDGGIIMPQYAYGTTPPGIVALNTSIALNNDQTWLNNSPSTNYLLLNSPKTVGFTLNNNGHMLTIDGTGSTYTKYDSLIGGGGLTKNGTGYLEIGGQYTQSTNYYTGITTINGGVLRVLSDTVAGGGNLGSGNLTINGGVLEYYYTGSFTRTLGPGTGQVQILGGASGFGCGNAVTFTLNNLASYEVVWGSAYFNPSMLVFNAATSGGITTFANRLDLAGVTRTVQVNTGSANISGVIRNSQSGISPAGLVKSGSSPLTLSAANTFDGLTTISNGILSLTSAAALQNSALDCSNSLTGDAADGLKINSATPTFGGLSGTNNLASVFTTTAGGYSSVTTLTLNPGAGFTDAYSGIIADGATGMKLTKSGLGTQVFSGANTYGGATTVNGGGTLVLDYSSQDNSKLSASAALNLGPGILALNGGTFTQAVASCTLNTGASFVTRPGGTATLNLNSITRSAGSTLDVPDNAVVLTSSGTGGGAILLASSSQAYATVNGKDWAYKNLGNTGIVSLGVAGGSYNATTSTALGGGGNNSDVGNGVTNTTLASGATTSTLRFNQNQSTTITIGASQTLSLTQGGLLVTANVGANDSIITGGTLQASSTPKELILHQYNTAGSLVVNSVIAGSAYVLTKSGPGTVALGATETYTGATYVNQGALLVNGALNSGSAVTVQPNATLGGNGIINGTVTVNNGGIIEPSLSGNTNTLTLSGSTAPTFNAGSILKIRVPARSSADQVSLSSPTPAFACGNLNLVIDAGGLTGGTFTTPPIVSVAKASSGITGTFAGVSVINNSGYAATVNYNTQTITVTLTGTGGGSPTITGATNFASAFNTIYGAASTAQNYPVTGANLTANITNTAAPGFEVSGDGGVTYGGTAIVTNVGGSASGTVFIRLAATASAGNYNSSNLVVLTSSGAASITNISSSSGNLVSPAAASFTVTNYTVTYDGAGHTATVSAITGVNGETGATVGTVNVTATTHTNAGSYAGDGWTFTPTANYVTNNGTVNDWINQASNTLAVTASPGSTVGYKDGVSYMATVQTNGVTVTEATGPVIFYYATYGTNANVAFSTNNAVAGVASSVTISNQLPRGTNLIMAEYASYGNFLGWTNTLVQTVTNHPPVAGDAVVVRSTTTLHIALTNLSGQWSDEDGDGLSLTAVDATTTNGINLSVVFPLPATNNTLQFTNNYSIGYSNSAPVNDRFGYTISDGYGGSASGYVYVVTNGAAVFATGQASIGYTNGGSLTLYFYGIPGFTYEVQRSPDLVNWVDISTNTLTTSPVITITDTNNPTAFYRLKHQ